MDPYNTDSESNRNPLLPLDNHLILKLVLAHVGRADVADLKNCRLVSHNWNKASVRVLEQQHGYAVQLDYKKMLEYKSLLWNTQLPRMNSSTELIDPLLSCLRLSLNIQPLRCTENLSEAAKWIQLLMTHSHLRIAFIYCDYIEYYQPTSPDRSPPTLAGLANLELFNLLKLAAAHLESITIVVGCYYGVQKKPSYFEEFDSQYYAGVAFPKLSSLDYGIHLRWENGTKAIVDWTKHILGVIQQAPKLIKLSLDVSEENEELSTKSFQMLTQACAPHLEKLEIAERNQRMAMNVLRETKFPKLKYLNMTAVCSLNYGFIKILEQQCPALTHIDHLWFSCDHEENFSLEDLTITQSQSALTNINHFGIFSPFHLNFPDDLEEIRWNFAAVLTKFPSLKSMGVSLDTLIRFGEHLKHFGHLVVPPPPDQYPVFVNVSSLVVHIQHSSDLFLDMMETAAQIYRHTFPYLTELILDLNIMYLPVESVEEYKKEVQQAIDFLCCQPRLEILEIQNYGYDFLAQLPEDNQMLQGLHSLKLVPPKRRITAAAAANDEIDDDDDYSPAAASINIMEIIARLPALESFQIGKKSLCTTEIQTIQSAMSSIRKFKN